MGAIGPSDQPLPEPRGAGKPAATPIEGVLVPECPNSECPNCANLQREINILRSDRGYWQTMHRKAVQREEKLKQEIKELKAKVRLRERQLFGRKSERSSNRRDEAGGQEEKDKPPPKKRGQQRGSKGHGRRTHDNLPVHDEVCELEPDDQVCPKCGLAAKVQSGTEDSEMIEVEVRAHRRRYRRRRYRLTCQCPDEDPDVPRIITAPPPPKLIPKGIFGISAWVYILEGKFLYQRPLYRILTELRGDHDLDLSQGTVTGGLKQLSPLFEPLYEAIIERNVSEVHWHADETRWLVFGELEIKPNPRWYLWVFCSRTTVVYRAEPTRSSEVAKDHFGEEAEGILSVDRYSAYKVLLNDQNRRIVLAFCWAHVRRDFLSVAKDWPHLEQWGLEWVNRIGKLYRLNKARLEVFGSADADPEAVEQAQQELSDAVEQMRQERDVQLADSDLHGVCRKALESLKRHWSGLVIFVEHPEVPMDNTEAERKLRGPVVGRKNYYGSGSKWSAELTVMLFSLFQTLLLWNFNVQRWLSAYLGACARAGGQTPPNPTSWLPWNMDEESRRKFERPTPVSRDTS